MSRFLCLILVVFLMVVSGSRSRMQSTHGNQLYDTGEIKTDGSIYSYKSGIYPLTHNIDNLFSQSSDFYRDGRLKSEVWSQGSNPLLKLEFYEDGRLESEERFFNGMVVFGMYFTAEGELARTVGQRLKN
ncbi:MAG: hypothetical protein GY869_21050 [Planctomycetes bacterium]|nr:hypothetical protein [Planctomycetota bacterium]